MHAELTDRQIAFLDYLRQAIARDGRTPSLRQSARELGISHAAVSQMIGVLEKKGFVRRDSKYQRSLHILNRTGHTEGFQRMREVPVVGSITAGLPLYAQQEWDGSIVLDAAVFPGQHIFCLRVKGSSMKGAGILDGDLVICEPCQYASNGEIVVALINHSEATVKRFFLRRNLIELVPENPDYKPVKYQLNEILVQGRVIGLVRSAKLAERR